MRDLHNVELWLQILRANAEYQVSMSSASSSLWCFHFHVALVEAGNIIMKVLGSYLILSPTYSHRIVYT